MIVPTMILVLVLSTFICAAVLFTQHSGRQARDSRAFTYAISVADGELDRLYDSWKTLVKTLPLGVKAQQSDLNSIAQPIPAPTSVNPNFTDATFLPMYQGQPAHCMTEVDCFGNPVAANQSGTSLGLLPGFNGLYSVNTLYDVRVAVAMPTISRSVVVEIGRTFTKADAPIFQAAIYYEGDLELHPGEAMTINGPVVTNQNLYAAGLIGQGLTFNGYVSYNQSFNYYPQPPPATGYNMANWQPPTYGVSQATQLSQTARLEPAGEDMRNAFTVNSGNPNTDDGYRELIQMPVSGFSDPAAISKFRFYNQASLKVSVSQVNVAGVKTQTVNVLGGDNNPAAPAVVAAVTAAIGTRFPMYDAREQQNVSVTPVDISLLGTAINIMNTASNAAQQFNGVIYFTDVSPDNTERAFRLENGSMLPTAGIPVNSPTNVRGFSVASDAGIYIHGDYNTYNGAAAVPSAVLADAVMILSNAWNDANAANPLYGVDNPSSPGTVVAGTARTASATTVNTAIMAGNIPTYYVNPNTGVTYGPSGGAHNFPRFLENWTNVPFTFTGSMAQLFTSTIFTGAWTTGNIYAPPIRNWSCNTDFINHPCPGVFCFSSFSRGPWRRY
jgi:hypothetical protein